MSLDKFKKHRPKKKPRGKHTAISDVISRFKACWEEKFGNRPLPFPKADLAATMEAGVVLTAFPEMSEALMFAEWAASEGRPLRCAGEERNLVRFERWRRRRSADKAVSEVAEA